MKKGISRSLDNWIELQLHWKLGIGMSWVTLGDDNEMYCKDHLHNGEIYRIICKFLSGNHYIMCLERVMLYLWINSPMKAKRLYLM